jgi:SAM-dependent methyltransferase
MTVIIYSISSFTVFFLMLGLFVSFRFETDGTLKGRLAGIFKSLGIFIPGATNISTLYKLWGQHVLTTNSKFINLGYWKNADCMDDAGRDLAHLLGEHAEISAADDVLDVGFGYGDQDLYWMKTFKPRSITGLNIIKSQVDDARELIRKNDLEDKINLQYGSATKIPFGKKIFDKILALECAFHFDSRDDFFQQAFHVLRDGGRLSVADIVPVLAKDGHQKPGFLARILEPFRLAAWKIPRSNSRMGVADYCKRLEEIGFINVRVTSISDHVFAPLRRVVLNTMNSPEVFKRLHPWHRTKISIAIYAAFISHGPPFAPMNYILVSADKAS